jgi:hypothetical protein
MSKVSYNKQSPWYHTPQATWFLGNLEYRDVPSHSSDKLITLLGKYENRPDLLSYDLYGTTDYWWIFMIRNPNVIKDPIYDMVTGIQLYAPTSSRLVAVLGG